MGQKDRSEKYLENYNDVFADLFNVLLFKKKWIREEKLRSLDTESLYKAADDSLGLQRRDILKEYGSGRFLVASLGIENQSTIDSDMPVRVMGYDYAAYRDQINKSKKRVPVITIILNFSRTEWKTPLSLKDMFHLSEDLDPFVQDYKIHVFNIAFLPKEVRNQFTSDFKIVADYFAERDNPDYQPDTQAIKHVEGVLEMFRVFTDDMRYDMIKSDVIEKRRKGGEVSMCTFVDRMVNLGIEQGEKRGMERGIERGMERGIERGMERGMKRGMKRGMAQGIARGEMRVLVHLTAKKWYRNQSVSEIAESLEEEETKVERIVKLLEEYGSDNTEEVVTKALEDQLLTK